MNGLTISLLLCAPVLAQCFPVAASQGGNSSVQLFFCKIPGCAANVTCVYCNDKLLFTRHTHITSCTGPPSPNTVCQHDGRAFVSTNADECEFEGTSGYIKTEKCTDHSKICDFISAITSPPVTTEGMVKDRAKHGLIVGGVGTLLLLIVGLYFCKKRGDQEQSQQATDVIEPLSEMQSPGETTEGDTRVHPGLNDDISPSQCDDGTSVFALICSEFGK
ncbi:uncharacterized protein LOC122876716 isoform X2 [Siniperca chuatsi]|nr:uncharacterized protein LOC122876716 isoform X2 [Siniperca chuatsi]XP_044053294.1 uncharacterized protein LOC122876716 isoform X2 [Siniperca chuatsi]